MIKRTLLICIVVLFSITMQAQYIGYTVKDVIENITSDENIPEIMPFDSDFGTSYAVVQVYGSGMVNAYLFLDEEEDLRNNVIKMVVSIIPKRLANEYIGLLHEAPFYYKELWYWYNYSYRLPNGRTITLVYDGDFEGHDYIMKIYPE